MGGGVGWVGGEMRIKANLNPKLKYDTNLRQNLDEAKWP